MVEIEVSETLSSYGYELIDFLGSGSFSNVFLCQNKQYKNKFAIKQLEKDKYADDEINALISLVHPSIVKLYATFSDAEHQYLVMEYCGKGNLKQRSKLEYDQFVIYSKQLLEVLDYCHSRKIVHRDIKPENIFFDQYEQVKLADFCLADNFENRQLYYKKRSSLMFCSPEILSENEFDPIKADIWALGVTFYYMATGRFPFPDYPETELRNGILYQQIAFPEEEISNSIKYMILKMCSKNPFFRPSAREILKFPIFDQCRKLKGTKTLTTSSSMTFDVKQKKRSQRRLLVPTFSDYSNEYEFDEEGPKKLSKVHAFNRDSLNFNTNTRIPNYQQSKK